MGKGTGITVQANLKKFNAALDEYAKKKEKDLNELIRWAFLETVSNVMKANPVRTGRSRAAWGPVLLANAYPVPNASPDPDVMPAEALKAQREGFAACKHKTNFKGLKPYGYVANRVKYLPYLEYGVRKGKEKNKSLKEAKLTSVSKRSGKGFVRKEIVRMHRAVKRAIRTGNMSMGG